MKGTPKRIVDAANAVRLETGMIELPVPVHGIAEAIVDILDEKPLSEGRDGMVVQEVGMTGITINSRLRSWGRKRFTVAHELGHVRLHQGTFRCLSRDLNSPSARDPREWEANEFAAELLMPQAEFRAGVGCDVPDLETVLELSDSSHFDVSLTAAALRAITLTDQQCLLVVSRGGDIQWTATSATFEVWTRRNGRVPDGSASARLIGAEPQTLDDDSSDADAWLDDRRIAAGLLELEEEAVALSDGWVVALLNPVDDVDMDQLEEQRWKRE